MANKQQWSRDSKDRQRRDQFDTSFDPPKPGEQDVEPPKPKTRLISCPSCERNGRGTGLYSETRGDAGVIGYCTVCSYERSPAPHPGHPGLLRGLPKSATN